MGISEQSTLLCKQKLLTSRQIFRYAVPARTVTKKALPLAYISHYLNLIVNHILNTVCPIVLLVATSFDTSYYNTSSGAAIYARLHSSFIAPKATPSLPRHINSSCDLLTYLLITWLSWFYTVNHKKT